MPPKKMNFANSVKALAIGLSITLTSCTSSTEPATKSEATSQYQAGIVKVNGYDIRYKEMGDGQPLILLQRFRGALNDWDPELIRVISQNNRVIIFDSVGVGESEGDIPKTVEGSADFVIDLMDVLEVETASILGWSLGGMTAQVVAIKYPNRVEKVILAGTTPPAGSKEVQLAPAEWTAVATKPENTPEDMAYLFYTNTDAGKKAAKESRLRFEKIDHRGVGTKTSRKTIMKQAVGARTYISDVDGWYSRLRQITAPVLIANGDSDLAFPAINSEILHREIPDSQLKIYPDAGHAFLFQYANQFGEDVSTFLKEK